MTLALGILVSGNGSNLQAIIDAVLEGRLDAKCQLVLSNRPSAYALKRAEDARIATTTVDHESYSSREEFDREVIRQLKAAGVQWVALAGFMRVLTPQFLEAFEDRVVNIHPSLLPAFPGVNAQRQAFEYGVKFAGCTVHFVERGVDSGPIILQRCVPVLADDSEETLTKRILQEEHHVFVEALSLIAQGRVRLEEATSPSRRRRVIIEGVG